MDSKKASTTNSKTKQKKHIVMQLQNRTFISEIALPYVCIFSKFFGEFPRKIFTFPQKYDRINREQQNQAQWGSMLTEQEGSSNMVYVTGQTSNRIPTARFTKKRASGSGRYQNP